MSDNIVQYKKPFSINIGIIVFFMIIVYVVFNIFSYYNSKSISEYEVIQGSIATNNNYRGIIVRQEEVVYADHSGYLNYYQSNGCKVSVNDLIYSVDANGIINSAIADGNFDFSSMSEEDITLISDSVNSFLSGYSSTAYAEVNQFKTDLSSRIDQAVNNQAMSNLSDQVTEAENNSSFFKGYPSAPGIVVFSIDGFENLTVDTFCEEDLSSADYEKQHLNSESSIEEGQPVYKLITSDDWNVIIEISSETAEKLADSSYVKVRFCEDDFTVSAACSLMNLDGQYFLNLSLTKGMIRYADERYIDLELILNEENGLKIPNSSITTKEFYTVPKDFFTQGGDSDALGLLVDYASDEEDSYVFVSPTIYYENEDYYYIDSEDVSSGDTIRNGNGSLSYVIGTDTDSLYGVYCINKGYAVFKQINIIYQNEEYTIVEQKTSYGISLYDHIALDADDLSENELIVQ